MILRMGNLFVCGLLLAGCQAQSGAGGFGQKAAGAVRVEGARQYDVLPAKPVRVIYVENFRLDTKYFAGDEGVQGALPGGGAGLGVLSGIRERLPHPLANKDSQGQTQAVVQQLSSALIERFREQGLVARPFSPSQGGLPREGWLVQGAFLKVNEGNRLNRAAVGLGQGASEMEVSVAVTDLGGDLRAPFLVFGTIKDPGRLPGGAATSIATKTPYAAAARFVMERNATLRDVNKTADQIAAEILKYKEQVEGRGRGAASAVN